MVAKRTCEKLNMGSLQASFSTSDTSSSFSADDIELSPFTMDENILRLRNFSGNLR